MSCRSSLINSPMDGVSVESSTSYSEQGHIEEVSHVPKPFVESGNENYKQLSLLSHCFPLYLNFMLRTFSMLQERDDTDLSRSSSQLSDVRDYSDRFAHWVANGGMLCY